MMVSESSIEKLVWDIYITRLQMRYKNKYKWFTHEVVLVKFKVKFKVIVERTRNKNRIKQ